MFSKTLYFSRYIFYIYIVADVTMAGVAYIVMLYMI